MTARRGPRPVLLHPPLVACFGITAALHLGTVLLNTLLPLHLSALGGTKTQVGFLFSVTTLVGMFLRPMVGHWVDRHGARRVIVPGALLLLATSLGFHLAAAPAALIGLMAGIGLAASLISTPASVHAAEVSPAERRGEVLGTYYLFSSLPIAVAAPLALALFRAGGAGLGFLVVSAMAAAVGALTMPLAPRAPAPAGAAGPGLRFVSRRALGLSGVLALATLGHSTIYGFVPLYAIARGQEGVLAWFFGVYSTWLIVCRALLRGVSDRVGRGPVLVPALAALAAGYACLALSPATVSLVAAAACLASGGALLYPTLVALVVDRTPPAERGHAIGTISGAWDVGVMIGSTLIGFVVERAGYGAGFAVGTAGALAALAAFVTAERRRPEMARA